MDHAFPIKPVNRFAGESEPEFACFSYDDEHVFHHGDSGLRWYYNPQIGADLSQGYETFIKHDDSQDEHLDSLLKTIIHHEQETKMKIDANIVTFIEENHEYRMHSQQEQAAQPWRGAIPQEVMQYWGYKFETLATLPAPWGETSRDYIENREKEVVNNKAQYCSVVRTGVGKTILCLGGEVDAGNHSPQSSSTHFPLWDSKPPKAGDPINWVELKTSIDIRGERDQQNFERKLLKFWIQSFLLGVPKIIVGFRSRDGILQKLEEIDVASIPTTVAQRGRQWDGNVCINFASAFLEWLRTKIDDDGVWRIRRRPKDAYIEVYKTEETTGHGRILSDEFINHRIKLSLPPAPDVGDGAQEPS
ncbi:hypothetical protein VSDG_07884 [Cytospora chrysosperma]|uniref:Decapping nuclease n=1 Tax=Cytospora chrysosperma TaxID=252740 RepID=A0A423VJG5_CYTCH|nr:hypothetical protein VSDG_07884 [Valsa sordida]